MMVRRGHDVTPLPRDVTMVRHFRGLDDEILRERQLTRKCNLPKVKRLRSPKDLLARLKDSTTVRIYAEAVRLFNAYNHETAQFRAKFPSCSTLEYEGEIIGQQHDIRNQVIQVVTDGSSTVTTVSFTPGALDHFQLTMDTVKENLRKEVSMLCARLSSRRSPLRHVHFGVKDGINITQLLNSSLHEISLPDLDEQQWTELAAGLVWNRSLLVLTVCYHRSLNTLFQTSSSIHEGEPIAQPWTRCNKTMNTLCITLPTNFPAEDRKEAKAMADISHRVLSVSILLIEYIPPQRPPKLDMFAKYLQEALAEANHVHVLHLLVPLKGLKLCMPWLKGLVFVSDFWGKGDLKEAKRMIESSQDLEIFGIRQQGPKRNPHFWERSPRLEITEADVVEFLELYWRVQETKLRILSLRGCKWVEGKAVSRALDERWEAQPNLYIDLIGTGLEKKAMRAPEETQGVIGGSDTLTTAGFTSPLQSRTSTSQMGNNCCVLEPTGPSTSGSSTFEISQRRDSGGIVQGSGSENAATGQQEQKQQQPRPFTRFSLDQLRFDSVPWMANPGRGAYGQVSFAELTMGTSTRKVAVKDLYLEGANWQRDHESFEVEMQTLVRLHHVNLMEPLGYCMEGGRRLLVYEFMPNFSLDRALDKWTLQDGVWGKLVIIVVGVAHALHHLHFGCGTPIVHLNVKPQNILLDNTFRAKLSDLRTERNLALLTQAQGKTRYMAPEISQDSRWTRKWDVYSFGVILMEIVSGKKFQVGHKMKVSKQFRYPSIPKDHEAHAHWMLHIATQCTNDDKDKRPDMKKVLQMLEGDQSPIDLSHVTSTI